MHIEKHHIEISKKGSPCIWETGDYYNSMGFSLIVANKAGEKKKAIYIPKKTNTQNFNHALIPIRLGDIIVKVTYVDAILNIKVYSILFIDYKKELASLTCLTEYNNNEWSTYEIAHKYRYAIMAATQKSTSRNVQIPIYIKNKNNTI